MGCTATSKAREWVVLSFHWHRGAEEILLLLFCHLQREEGCRRRGLFLQAGSSVVFYLFPETIPKWRICKFQDFIAWSKVLGSQHGWRSGETVNCWQGFNFPSEWCLDTEGFTKDPKRKLKASFFLIFAYYRNQFQTKEKKVLEAAVTCFQVTYTELLIWPLLRRWKISRQHSFMGV